MEWFWHVLVICVVVIPVALMWLAIIYELFTRKDLKWWQRIAWLVFVLVLPLVGSLIYLGYTWATAGRRAPGSAAALPRVGRHSADASDADGDLASLDRLRRSGAITEAEFEAGRRRVLEGTTPDDAQSATQTTDGTLQAAATDGEPKNGAP